MPIPSVNELLNEVLIELSSGNTYRRKDLVFNVRNNLVEKGVVTKEEASEKLKKSGYLRLDNRIDWAITYLFQAGLIKRINRGVYTLNDRGKLAVNNIPINIEYLNKYPEFKEWMRNSFSTSIEDKEINSNTDSLIPTESTEEILEKTYEEIQKKLKNELLEILINIEPYKFEQILLELLKKMGYGEPQETQRTKDDGIDGIVKADKFGFDEIYIQAKRWKNKVGVEVVNNFIGALARKGASSGVIITTSDFSEEAKRAVEEIRAGGTKIVLVNGDKLSELMIEYNVGVYVKYTYEIKAIDENFFEG